jgi:cholesterol transport system auxiliary component
MGQDVDRGMAHRNNDAGRKTARAGLFVVALTLALSGCGQPARETFDLSGTAPAARLSGPGGGAALSVREPTAVAPTNADRIVVRDYDGSVSVLPGVQWSDRLPRLLRTRMIEALRNSGVAAAPISLGAERSLVTDIARFEIDVARDLAVVEISARIVDESGGATRASQHFTAEVPAPDHTGAAAVQALTDAAGQVLSRLSSWARGRR